jgi:hypothetical protein
VCYFGFRHRNKHCFQVQTENMCDIVGFSGAITAIVQSVELVFNIGSYKIAKSHKFAVVWDDGARGVKIWSFTY